MPVGLGEHLEGSLEDKIREIKTLQEQLGLSQVGDLLIVALWMNIQEELAYEPACC